MPERIGRYEVRETLGRGGFGEVYLAHDPSVGRDVAIKVLTAIDNPELLARFRREAQSAGALTHNNIVALYDYGELGEAPYLVMEFVQGRTLQAMIGQTPGPDLLTKVEIMAQVAEGLHYAHRRGIVHRDVKPSNIMVTPDGTAKITDFGIAHRLSAGADRLTRSGDLIGTPHYMAPEQFQEQFDSRSDIWSYGVVFQELLTGTNPFQAASAASTMFKILQQPAPLLGSLVPDCGEALERIVHRCLEIDPGRRYQSLDELRLDLEPVLRDLQGRRAAVLISAAQSFLAEGKPEEAQALVRQVLEVEPGNPLARELLDSIRQRNAALTRDEQVRRLVESARAQIASGQLMQARRTVEAASLNNPEMVELREMIERMQAAKTRAMGSTALAGAPTATPVRGRSSLLWAGVGLMAVLAVIGAARFLLLIKPFGPAGLAIPLGAVLLAVCAGLAVYGYFGRRRQTPAREAQPPPADATIIERAPGPRPIERAPAPAPPPPPRDDATRLIRSPAAGPPRAHLTFTACADPLMVGRRCEITSARFVIGRSAPDLPVRSDPALSRHHAAIEWDGNQFTITDLGSKNATYLDGRRLSGLPEPLVFGSQIRLSSSTTLTFSSDTFAEMPDLTGQVIDDRFSLVRLIRASAKASVYEARDADLPRSVALKILSPTLASYPGYIEQFTREAETAASLRHPHICKVLDHGTARIGMGARDPLATHYVYMDLMEGGSLSDRLATQKRFPVEQVARWLDQLTSALEYAHSQGVTHSGLKPTSIVFDSLDQAYVADFAFATQAGQSRKEAFLGAPDFMAPEQWDGKEPTHRTDQYALAALTYLMLTGCRPYEGQMDPDIRQGNFARGPAPVHEQAARSGVDGLAASLSPVLRRALSVEPEDRYDSIRDFFLHVQQARANPGGIRSGPPQVFISYRRDLSAGWANLFARELKDKHNVLAFVDTLRADVAVKVPVKVRQAIRDCDYFVCLLANNTLRSEWVQEEIRLAWESGKPMIPVFQESFVPPESGEDLEPHVQALISYECVHLLDLRNIHVDHTIADLARMVVRSGAAGA